MSFPEVSVVIPVYWEAENIARTIQLLDKVLPDNHEIICVYDVETDTTLPVLRELIKEYSGLRTAKNRIAPGPSGALRTGFLEAMAARVLVVMADGCDDFSQIPQLIDLVPDRFAIACPSRYCQGGRQELDATFKIWLPRTAGLLLRVLTGLKTADPTNSFKMYSADLLNRLELKSTVSFSVTLEIVVKAHRLGCRIVELPTVWKNRTEGESNFKVGPSIPAYLKWFLLCLSHNMLFRGFFSWLKKRPTKA